MRKTLLAPVLVLATILSLAVSGLHQSGHAQIISGPVPNEFDSGTNATALGGFRVQCAPNAFTPCPDAPSAQTWTANDPSAPGVLRIWTQRGSLIGTSAQASNDARNLVLQPFDPYVDWIATTRMTFPGVSVNPTPVGQTAGLIVYQDADNYIFVGRQFNATGSQLVYYQESGGIGLPPTLLNESGFAPTVYFRIVKFGTTYQALYSYDNVTFAALNPTFPTATPTATATATATSTVGPSPTAATATPTSTLTPVATTTPPNGYQASYASPQVGLFAFGGTNGAANSYLLPADFDWFRVGFNSQTPQPITTTTSIPTSTTVATNTVIPTSTTVPSATATATLIPPVTNTPLPTSTETATATATATATVAVPTPTPKPSPPPKPKVTAFSYTSVWYRNIHRGNVEHLQAQAKAHVTQGIWVHVYFATGMQLAYYTNTDRNGLFARDFVVPSDTIGRYSGTAVVTFQLWRGKATTKSWEVFNVIR